MKRPRVDFLPATGLHEEPELWYQQQPCVPIRLHGECRQICTKERWLHGLRRASKSYSTFKVRRGGHEERLLVQGKEQWLCYAGTAVKRYSTSKVRETQGRW